MTKTPSRLNDVDHSDCTLSGLSASVATYCTESCGPRHWNSITDDGESSSVSNPQHNIHALHTFSATAQLTNYSTMIQQQWQSTELNKISYIIDYIIVSTISQLGWLNLSHSPTLPPPVTGKHRVVVKFQEMSLRKRYTDTEERLWEKEGFKTRVENAMKNVNNRSRIRTWWWRRAGWLWGKKV